MEEKQNFTTFDSFSVLALMAGVIVLVGAIVTNAMIDQRLERAQTRAQQLAAQILVGGISRSSMEYVKNSKSRTGGASSNNDQSRGIASITPVEIDPTGRIGMDPWGTPFFYKISNHENGERMVEVISAGPDRVLQSELGSLNRAGDDILAVEKAE